MMKTKRWLLPFLLLISCSAGSQDSTSVQVQEKIKGLNYTGPARGPVPPDMIFSMKEINGNYIALVPEATLYRQNLQVAYNRTGGWFGESMQATMQGIELARENGLRVMIKPHVSVGYDRSGFNMDWSDTRDSVSRAAYREKYNKYIENQPDKLLSEDRWRGSVMVKKESDWNILAENYTDFIMDYARLADSMDVELFCIGTELKAMALEKPAYWRELVEQVKQVYSGKLTYAANWDSYDKITFWDELDLIGIDAYFPLSSEKNPDISILLNSWEPYKKDIQTLSQEVGIPVVFTEWGYENENYAAETPWVADGRETEDGGPYNHNHLNPELQSDLYEATFQTFWNEPWFAGLFVWRWSPPEELNRGIPTYNYSPKGKPAEQVIEKWFGKDSVAVGRSSLQ
jgi:hypothetical protein